MKLIRDKSPLKRVYSKDSPEFLKDGKTRERQASRKKSKEGRNSPIKGVLISYLIIFLSYFFF